MNYRISGSQSVPTSPKSHAASPRDSEIQQLNKQKAKWQEELQKVNSNAELDSKIKAERVRSITSNIQQIEMRISEIRAEEIKQKTEEAQPSTPAPQETKPELDPHLVAVIEKSVSYDQLSKMVSQKTDMKGSITRLEGEVRMDRAMLEHNPHNDSGKSLMLENAENTTFKMKREMAQELQGHIHSTNQKIGELISSINETNEAVEPAKQEDKSTDNGVTGQPSKPSDKSAGDSPVSESRNEPAAIDIKV
ncbi:FlxA-like family protein [Cohnella boryungensis]|uniref:FlxA-like family protein n=1 Tax=Cohnella boryungensis TaxID=768479 RepID=A0ABV8S8P9_9BACL